MKAASQKLLFCIFTAFVALSHSASAQDNLFHRVHLAYGISLDVPSHWTVLSRDDRKNNQAAAQAMIDNSGMEELSGGKEFLLGVNASPSPTGAMIRVSATPIEFTQKDLEDVTTTDMKELGIQMLTLFKKLEASGGPKIIEMQPIRIDKIKNYRVLVIPYIRASVNGPSPWQVTQYQVPISNRFIQITLSHRKSDAVVWRPILEKIYRSIQL